MVYKIILDLSVSVCVFVFVCAQEIEKVRTKEVKMKRKRNQVFIYRRICHRCNLFYGLAVRPVFMTP